jgi:high-affinity nickel-transport protein
VPHGALSQQDATIVHPVRTIWRPFLLHALAPFATTTPLDGLGLLATALVLGLRHGIDWDHIAAIADITSTTAATEAAEEAHRAEHGSVSQVHAHGGGAERTTHEHADHAAVDLPASERPVTGARVRAEQRRAIWLGSLYAFGHAAVVAALGLAALTVGALLPDWVDPVLGRVVGITLIVLGLWVLYSAYGYVRHGAAFRLRSRWMLAFDSLRYGWRWFGAKLHGHAHVEPLEASAYGPRTAFTVGMVHGIGAETGSQVLLIAAIGGAAAAGLGIPMMLAFILGLLITNSIIVIVSAFGFAASQVRSRLYLAVGVTAGIFSLVVGVVFVLGADAILPTLA